MPLEQYTFGPFASVWIGDTYSVAPNLPTSNGTPSTAALVKVDVDSTGGGFIRRSWPTKWNQAKQKKVRSGPYNLQFDISFMGNDLMIDKISEGLSLSASASYIGANQSNFYCIFAADANPFSEESYLIPCCQVNVDANTNRQKTALTITKVNFEYNSRDMSYGPLYYKGTYAELAATAAFSNCGERIPTQIY